MAREIVMPRLSDSMEDGTVLRWLVAQGDSVEEGQPLVEVETDKANVTYDADSAGVILALSVGEGATVPVGSPIAIIGAAGEQLLEQGAPEASAAAVASAAPPASAQPSGGTVASGASPRGGGQGVGRSVGAPPSAPAPGARGAREKASPLARRIAARLQVDLSTVAGSGPQGRVIRADVEGALAANGSQSTGARDGHAAAASESTGTAAAAGKGDTALEELTRLQATVARRMAESRATVPDIELRREVDMSAAAALREQFRELADDPPSFNDFIVKAAALALREFPRVNGAYRDARFESYSRVNVGIAVAGEHALAVPTIFDADVKSLAEIGRTARALAARVRDGSIAPTDLAGGTFTVSNLGMYGVDSFSAVINPPQAAILAVGSLRPRPVVDEAGALVARPTVQLTLACDHRILYGVDGARFLGRVSELLERPLSLML